MTDQAEPVAVVAPLHVTSASSPSAESRILTWLLGRGSPTYAILVLALSLVKYGAGLYPSWNLEQALAQNWRDPHSSPLLQPFADFRLVDPVSPVAAAWLHLTGDRAYLGFHLILALGAIVTPFALPAVRRTAELRLAIGLLVIGGAIPAVLLSWIGSYDPVTLAAAAVAALALNPVIAGVAWGVFAFNNAPEATVAFAVFAVVLYSDQRRPALLRLGISAAGFIAGYIAIQIVTSQWGGATSQLALSRHYGLSRLTATPENFWPLIFVSTLGAGWIFVTSRDVRALLPVRLFTGLAVLGSIVLAFGLDDTRVISTVMWPGLLLVAVIVVNRLSRERVHELLIHFMPIALLMVIVIVWDDQLVYAGWNSLNHLVQYIFGHTPIPFQD